MRVNLGVVIVQEQERTAECAKCAAGPCAVTHISVTFCTHSSTGYRQHNGDSQAGTRNMITQLIFGLLSSFHTDI